MRRRKAVRNIALLTSGIALLPACQFEGTRSLPVYENIPLDQNQYALIEWLIEAILPKGEPKVTTPESTPHFVLTMINDCYDPVDIRKYLTGMQLFQQYVQDEYQMAYEQLNPAQNILLFTELSESKIIPKNLSYFINTTKRLTVQHFTTSEYFLKNHLEFEFAPGRYLGCVSV